MLIPSDHFAERLLTWYDRFRRNLPWRSSDDRPGQLDPYHVLVSETMLQQTQVATVIDYYHRFVARFPTFADLAAAPEQEVLRLWQGLGYYSRARNLQKTAQMVVNEHGGKLPCKPDALLKLPGIGRYTAGAIASIAFDVPAPILDGNVTRMLCRLDNITADPRDKQTQRTLWRRAEQIVPRSRPGDFNSALMELGATICTPRNPQCLICPVRTHCEAQAAGVQEKIPAPRKARPTPLIRRQTYCISDGDRWLIEQRPPRGRWAGMWQFITIDPDVPQHLSLCAQQSVFLGQIRHSLTHRRYTFDVYLAREVRFLPSVAGEWVSLDRLDNYPLPRPHLKIAEMLREHSDPGRRCALPPA